MLETKAKKLIEQRVRWFGSQISNIVYKGLIPVNKEREQEMAIFEEFDRLTGNFYYNNNDHNNWTIGIISK